MARGAQRRDRQAEGLGHHGRGMDAVPVNAPDVRQRNAVLDDRRRLLPGRAQTDEPDKKPLNKIERPLFSFLRTRVSSPCPPPSTPTKAPNGQLSREHLEILIGMILITTYQKQKLFSPFSFRFEEKKRNGNRSKEDGGDPCGARTHPCLCCLLFGRVVATFFLFEFVREEPVHGRRVFLREERGAKGAWLVGSRVTFSYFFR